MFEEGEPEKPTSVLLRHVHPSASRSCILSAAASLSGAAVLSAWVEPLGRRRRCAQLTLGSRAAAERLAEAAGKGEFRIKGRAASVQILRSTAMADPHPFSGGVLESSASKSVTAEELSELRKKALVSDGVSMSFVALGFQLGVLVEAEEAVRLRRVRPGVLFLRFEFGRRRMQWMYFVEAQKGKRKIGIMCEMQFKDLVPDSAIVEEDDDETGLFLQIRRPPDMYFGTLSGEIPYLPSLDPFPENYQRDVKVEEEYGELCQIFTDGKERHRYAFPVETDHFKTMQFADYIMFQVDSITSEITGKQFAKKFLQAQLAITSGNEIPRREIIIMNAQPFRYDESTLFQSLPFVIRWKIGVLLTRCFLAPSEIDESLLEDIHSELKLDDLSVDHNERDRLIGRMVLAFDKVISTFIGDIQGAYSKFDKPRVIHKIFHFDRCLRSALRAIDSKKHERKLVESLGTRKVDAVSNMSFMGDIIVTPSKIYCTGPSYEINNRLLRRFNDKIDCFVRVSFMDENLYPVWARSACINNEIFQRVFDFLRFGFSVHGRTYEFLMFSQSQIRSHSCWFVDSKNLGHSSESIRSWMGDASHIQCPGKYAARLGLSLSTTVSTTTIEKHEFKIVPDKEKFIDGIKPRRYIFTDGCGLISPQFAEEISTLLGYDRVPSAFQVRFMGAKGMLLQYKIKPNLKLELRRSMVKFRTAETPLEVCDISRNRPCFLNRQIIVLLSTLGVPDQSFINMQESFISDLDEFVRDRDTAVRLLKNGRMSVDAMGSIWSSRWSWSRSLANLLSSGFSINEEFLSQTLRDIRNNSLFDLRTKSRIPVANGTLVFGVFDPTKKLKYGQCVIQLSSINDDSENDSDSSAVPIIGNVVVTRNPCLHPGDIRILKAVPPPAELSSVRDVIIFPVDGPRPHANEMSGGDLDGDMFSVYWEKDLFPPKIVSPMEYQSPGEESLDRPVEIADIHKFFVNCMSNASLGVICNAHLVWADRSDLGAGCDQCLKLAELASIAVDFPKTGIAAKMPSNLRVQEYPDFMEKHPSVTYTSEKVLGKLYRRVLSLLEEEEKLDIEDDDHSELKSRSLNVDPLLVLEGHEKYLDSAEKYEALWETELESLMSKYEIVSESQIFSGAIRTYNRLYEYDKDVVEKIRIAVGELVRRYMRIFKEDLAVLNSSVRELEELRKASAWYVATYRKKPISSRRLLSFAWLLPEQLIAIRTLNVNLASMNV